MSTESLKRLVSKYQGTHASLAERLGVPEATFSRWLNGRINTRHPVMLELAIEQIVNKQVLQEEIVAASVEFLDDITQDANEEMTNES